MRDTCTCTPVRAFRFYYQSTYTYMSASVFCGPFARPGGVLARGRLPPAAGRPRARRIRLSYRLVKSQWFIGYVCMLTCAHINIACVEGAIHLLHTHKFQDFRPPHPPVRTDYDVTMTKIHWRTHGAWPPTPLQCVRTKWMAPKMSVRDPNFHRFCQ